MCGDGYGGRRVRHDARGAGQHAACESGSCRLRSSRWGWGVSHGQGGVMAISWDYQFPLRDRVHSSFYLGKTQICKPSRHAGLASSAHKSKLGTHKVSCPHDTSDARMVTGAHPTNRVGTYCAPLPAGLPGPARVCWWKRTTLRMLRSRKQQIIWAYMLARSSPWALLNLQPPR